MYTDLLSAPMMWRYLFNYSQIKPFHLRSSGFHYLEFRLSESSIVTLFIFSGFLISGDRTDSYVHCRTLIMARVSSPICNNAHPFPWLGSFQNAVTKIILYAIISLLGTLHYIVQLIGQHYTMLSNCLCCHLLCRQMCFIQVFVS